MKRRHITNPLFSLVEIYKKRLQNIPPLAPQPSSKNTNSACLKMETKRDFSHSSPTNILAAIFKGRPSVPPLSADSSLQAAHQGTVRTQKKMLSRTVVCVTLRRLPCFRFFLSVYICRNVRVAEYDL